MTDKASGYSCPGPPCIWAFTKDQGQLGPLKVITTSWFI